jgi:hypothetical protein
MDFHHLIPAGLPALRQLELPVVLPHGIELPACLIANVTVWIVDIRFPFSNERHP